MLQKQQIDIPVNASIDTKTDAFLINAESAELQENVRFFKAGANVKRNGFDNITGSLPTGAKRLISDSKHLYAVGEANENSIYQYFNGSWVSMADGAGLNLFTQIKSGQLKIQNSFGGDGLVVGTYCDYFDGIYAITADRVRYGQNIITEYPILYIYDGKKYISVENFAFTATTDLISNCRCAIIQVAGVKYVITSMRYVNSIGTYLKVCGFTLTGTKLFDTDTPLTGTVGWPAIIHSSDRTTAIVAVADQANVLRVQRYNQTGSTASVAVPTTAAMASVEDLWNGPSDIAILTRKTDGYPMVRGVTTALAASWEQAESNATLSYGTVTGQINSSGISHNGTNYIYAFSVSGSSISRITAVMQGGSGGFARIAQAFHYRVTGRPQFSSGTYLPLVTWSASQFSTFTVAKVVPNNIVVTIMPVVNALYATIDSARRYFFGGAQISAGQFATMALPVARTDYGGGTGFSSTLFSKAALFTVNVANSDYQIGSVCNLGESLALYDGNPTIFDGSSALPAGLFFPPVIDGAVPLGAGGLITAGTYLYKIHFERTDDQGDIIRSEESPQVSVTTTGSTSRVLLSFPISTMMPPGTRVVVTRTQASGSIFFVLTKQNIDVTQAFFSFEDTTPDSAITSNTIQTYTTGGLLENTPCPPTLHATIHQNRVWVVPADEKDKVYYSKKILEGEAPAFNVFQFIEQASTVPGVQDDIVGVSPVGDKLVIFRQNSIFWVAGDGVNEAGVGATLTEPELLAQDIGCLEPRSIIQLPLGTMFKSAKGIYLVDNSLQLKYVGDRVETYNSEEIRDASLDTTRNLVKFATANRVMVYDYLFDKWSTDTVTNTQSLGAYENKTVILKTDGTVGLEGTGYEDNFGTPAPIFLRYISGWLKLTGIQNFGRVYRALILGRYYSAHALIARVYYDYDTSYSETFTITPNPVQGIYQFKLHLRKQKCESIKIELFDTGTGRSMDLVGLTLEVGVKQGTAKINPARQY